MYKSLKKQKQNIDTHTKGEGFFNAVNTFPSEWHRFVFFFKMNFFTFITQTYVTNVTLRSWARGLTEKTPNNILEAVLRVNIVLRVHGKNESEKCIFRYMFVVTEAEHNIKFVGCSKPVNPYKLTALTVRYCTSLAF